MPTKLSPDAQKIAKQFEEFAYVVSHDLSTPLRGIVEFSKLLKTEEKAALSEEGKEYLSLIIESGEKMQAMLLGLLDFSRLNTMSKPFRKVDCNRVLEDCRVVLESQIKTSKARLDIDPLPSITADAEQLMQIFLLLLDNALKFYPAKKPPQVKVSAKKLAGALAFIVRDNGIGIDPEFHQQIFQPFQRLHTDDEYPGIGMGLTLARKIVERHGGSIKVDSSVGKGASFIFTLPDKEED